jgi:hypothetical protein
MQIEITYRGEPAAVVGKDWQLLPALADLAPEHPIRHFVSLMAVYAVCFADDGFDQRYVEQVTRQALMPVEDLSPWPAVEDEDLVELYCVPLEQVRARRAELRVEWPS